jgi:hypothetical protein
MKTMLVLLLALSLCACTTVTATKGDFAISRTAVGTNLAVSKLNIKSEADGSFTIIMQGALSDSAQMVEQAMQIATMVK